MLTIRWETNEERTKFEPLTGDADAPPTPKSIQPLLLLLLQIPATASQAPLSVQRTRRRILMYRDNLDKPRKIIDRRIGLARGGGWAWAYAWLNIIAVLLRREEDAEVGELEAWR